MPAAWSREHIARRAGLGASRRSAREPDVLNDSARRRVRRRLHASLVHALVRGRVGAAFFFDFMEQFP